MGDGTRKQGRAVKIGRKSGGRPIKKVADRKGFSRVNNTFDDLIKTHSKNAGPLFQRLLSAIILEDGIEEFDEINEERGKSVNHRSSSNDCQLYEQMCVEDRLMLELQSVGIFVETHSNTKALTNFSKGKRTAKPKPKQKTAKLIDMDSGKEKEASAGGPQKTAATDDVDIPMREEFRSDLGGNLDLSTWFEFDDDEVLQEDGDSVGLDIPMDDLTELMF